MTTTDSRRGQDVASDALLAAVLTAWENGVKRWQENHTSYPTAFSELAHVMDDVQAHIDTANTADSFGKKE